MTADSPTGPCWCPPWCTGDDHLPDFPEDGYWHYGAPVTITVTHGSCETIDPEPLEIALQAWADYRAAPPGPPLIGLSLDREEGPHLTPAEARQLAAILLTLSDQAEQPFPPSPRAAPGMETR